MFSHPHSVCMTYLEHLVFSTRLAVALAVGAVQAMVHAVWPDVYVTATSDLVDWLTQTLKNAGCR